MRSRRTIWLLMSLLLLFASCDIKLEIKPSDGTDTPPESEASQWDTDLLKGADKHGLTYVYDRNALPEIHLSITLSEWNRLLDAYDRDSNTKEQIHCNAVFIKNAESTSIEDAGLRLKGNTSRRRPEGNGGEHHKAGSTDWRHVHFQLNLHKFVKDEAHEVHGAQKIILKWFKDDPSYVREQFCYDAFYNAGVWQASWASYCKLYLKIEGDPSETYYGIYSMIEPVDEDFLKVRKAETLFDGSKGNLWKCRYGSTLDDVNASMGPDLDDGREYTYELKTNVEEFTQAKAQLQYFIGKLRTLSGDKFSEWMEAHCDVDLLLKTYAMNVVLGMWDDYWNNSNNYYIYFNTNLTEDFRFFFIPYDYDNTLGTTGNCGVQQNAGKQDPFNWGDSKKNPLISKLLSIPQWKEIYRQYLLEMVAERDGKTWQEASVEKILEWQSFVAPFVDNDTNEDCRIADEPASWSTRAYYRLTENSSNNYFKIKTESINKYCK